MPLIVGTNAYLNQGEADAYFATKLQSSGWTSASFLPQPDPDELGEESAASIRDERAALVARQDTALIEATAAIDRIGFGGSISRYDQLLAWPRLRMRDREGRSIASNAVPQAVRDATCEMALHLLTAPAAKPSPAVSRKRVGDLEIQYRATTPDTVPPAVRQLLAPFLAGSTHSVELIP